MKTEISRVFSEFFSRVKKAKTVLFPPKWNEEEWRSLACVLAVTVQKHGHEFEDDTCHGWWSEWESIEGKFLCQVKEMKGLINVIVSQVGGFAAEPYTWLWAEMNSLGEFHSKPYIVPGGWRDNILGYVMCHSGDAGLALMNNAGESIKQLQFADAAEPN